MPTLVSTGQITIVDVNDGVSLSLSLTNDSAVLSADNSGVVASFVGAETQLKVFEAGVDVSSKWDFYVSATGGGVSYRDSDDAADRTTFGSTGNGGLGGTNAFRYSSLVGDAVWGKSAGITVSPSAGVSPDGTQTAELITVTTAGTGYYQLITGANSQVYTASVYFKAGTTTSLRFGITSQSETYQQYYTYTFATGALALFSAIGFTGGSGQVEAVGNGWFRFIVTATSPSTGMVTVGSFTKVMVAGGTCLVWGGQLTLTSSPGTYAPTQATARSGTPGYLKLVALSQDLSYFDIVASQIGKGTYSKRFSVAKARQGAVGSSSVSATLTTDAIVFPADVNGNVSSYASNTTVMTVRLGLTDDSAAWSYTRVDGPGVTSSLNTSTRTLTVSALAAGTDNSYVDITATKASNPNIVKRLTISKSRSGAQGATGTGVTGPRGTVQLARAVTVAAWSDTEANAALTAAGYGSAVTGDVVTLHKAAESFSQARVYTEGTWQVLAAYLNGSLLVDGTVVSSKVDTRGLSIKDTAGNVILAAGASLAASTFAGDVTGNIDGTLASTVKTNASTALTNANAANTLLADIASDAKLTPLEKQSLLLEWNAAYNEKAGINAQATAMGITTENTTYNTAFQALGTYLHNGTAWTISATPPSWLSNDFTITTTIVGSTFRTNWASLYSARQALLNKIADVAATKANWSSVSSKPPDSELLNTQGAFQSERSWDFNSSVEGWYSQNNCTLNTGLAAMTVVATGGDPHFRSPEFSVYGPAYTKVRARLRRTSGDYASWDGACFFTSDLIGDYTGLAYKVINSPCVNLNEWVVAEWDMANLSKGGNSWTGSTITSIRLDLGATTGDTYEIDWIAIGSNSPGSYGAEFGRNVFGKITPGNASTYIADAALGSATIANTLQADNYVANSAGWFIRKSDGYAEFGNIWARGNIQATSLNVVGSGGSRTEIVGDTIKVYEGGVLRVKIGNLA